MKNISIKGKIDFLIESENENLIIDFKTGSSVVKEQLKFYSYLFFLHEYPHKKVSSFFYKIFDLAKIDNEKNEMNYLKIIEEKVAEIKKKGFFANLKSDYLPEISRSDLMEKKMKIIKASAGTGKTYRLSLGIYCYFAEKIKI